MDDRDALDRRDVRDVDPGHDRVLQAPAEILDRGLDDGERAPGLIDDPAGERVAVLIEPRGARDADHVPVTDGARVAELELVLGLRAVEEPIGVGRWVRHALPPAA